MKDFLPINMTEAIKRGWEKVDFVLITGDAYVDHPSFGAAIIARLLEKEGYSMGIIAQPDWKNLEEFKTFGRPRLGFLVTSGNIDSMVAKYTSFKKKRAEDLYSPGGITGKRPDRALLVYASAIRQAYRNIPIILGGLEASLRRLSHYDYWSNSIRRSVLIDSKADILVYGMGETSIIEIAGRLKKGEPIKTITDVRGTVCRVSQKPEKTEITQNDIKNLYSYEEASMNKELFARNFSTAYKNNDPVTASVLVEKTGEQYVIQNKPSFPLTTEELDAIYDLPFTREAHPSYDSNGGVPALLEIKFSITSSRGCFGSCSFCALTFHQGKRVSSRSHNSILKEARQIASMEDFKGYIHDVGGPTANFRNPSCKNQLEKGCCDRRCLTPSPCKNLETSHKDYIELLRKLRKIDKVKKVFIRSGIRFDYLLLDPDVSSGKKGNFLEELCEHHISGQLRVAPEHVSDKVLKIMGKPKVKIYEEFLFRFKKENEKLEKKQYVIPYFISAHPGSTIEDAIELALYLKENKFIPDQVQDFYPTPGTLSSCMYYTGIDPLTLKKIYIPQTEEEKRMQKALLHFHKPENYFLVKKALEKAGRRDLIGNHSKALISAKGAVASTRYKSGSVIQSKQPRADHHPRRKN
ncbi:MAG: YgiQ family radical SAM protein [Spirochaetaceae bacterium]|nr:YgiQ family radical SAM protein [Spirochaetaceae bacterium]